MNRVYRLVMMVMTVMVMFTAAGGRARGEMAGTEPGRGNPILPGYYADPSIVAHDGKFYLYATLDPWGDETLGCWESGDLKQWVFRELNWPTRAACKSPTSGNSAVWAPSVVRGRDGRFYMYVSVHNEIWAGVADHPLGPWRNAVVGDKPLIDGKFKPGYHMIDAEAFIDDDGAAYLYWGSGWNWKNGKCFAVKLKADMVSFDSEVMDVTPARYFEAPLMIKRHGKYFLMYSDGITVEDTYEVHYAVGDGPLGPFTLGKGSPVLSTDKSTNVISPGHHTILHHGGQDYIVYHRHSIPFVKDAIGRQMCMDVIRFNAEGTIDRVEPTHEGPAVVRDRLAGAGLEVIAAKATASSSAGEAGGVHGPGRVVDDNYATRWAAEPGADGAWIKLDLGSVQRVSAVRILPEYAWKRLRFAVETSEDGQQWHTVADFTAEGGGAQGSPIVVSGPAGGPADGAMQAQYIRLTFPADVKGNRISLWEVQAVR